MSGNQFATVRALAGNATDCPTPIVMRKHMIAAISRNAPASAQAIDHTPKPTCVGAAHAEAIHDPSRRHLHEAVAP